MSQAVNPIQVRCPRCKHEFFYHQSIFRPFCSDRCQMIDMGQWLLEGHSIPGQVLGEVNEDEIMSEEKTWQQ